MSVKGTYYKIFKGITRVKIQAALRLLESYLELLQRRFKGFFFGFRVSLQGNPYILFYGVLGCFLDYLKIVLLDPLFKEVIRRLLNLGFLIL